MEIGKIIKDEIPMKNQAMSQCLVFIEKCVPKRKKEPHHTRDEDNYYYYLETKSLYYSSNMRIATYCLKFHTQMLNICMNTLLSKL